MLNEAYKVLIKDDLRKDYDASIGSMKAKFGSNESGFSSWEGPLRPQALFVDANKCIGCSFLTYFYVPFIASFMFMFQIPA